MLRTKKAFAVLSSTVLLAGVLAGCGGNNSTSNTNAGNTGNTANGDTEASPATAEKVTLKILIDNQTSLDGYQAVADEIEKRFNIATEFDLRPGGSEGDNLVKTRLATGDMDDMSFYNSGSLFKALDPAKYYVDLSDEPFLSNVMDVFKEAVSVDGKVYAAPGGSSQGGGWLYNKKVYTELGLSVPKTWAELMANNEKIKAAGKTAVIGSFKDSWTAQVVLLADYYNVQNEVPTFADDYTNNKAKFATTPAALRGFEKMQELKPYLNEDNLATTYDTALKMLTEGTGVQYPMISFALSAINSTYPDKINDIGVFAQPSDTSDKNGLTVWMPGSLAIYKESPHVEEAKKWMEFFLSPEGVAILASKTKPDGPYMLTDAKLPDDSYEGVKDMLPYFDAGTTASALEFESPLKGPNLPQISVESAIAIKTPEESAKAYDKDVEKQAKQLGLAGW